jgi:hypothetical protein
VTNIRHSPVETNWWRPGPARTFIMYDQEPVQSPALSPMPYLFLIHLLHVGTTAKCPMGTTAAQANGGIWGDTGAATELARVTSRRYQAAGAPGPAPQARQRVEGKSQHAARIAHWLWFRHVNNQRTHFGRYTHSGCAALALLRRPSLEQLRHFGVALWR